MGVDLGEIIPREKVELEQLSGWKLAVDAYNTLYQFLAIIRGASGEHLKDSRGRVTSHLSGLFYRSLNLLELGMKLVYIFDGKPPELKATEIERRSSQRREAQVQYVRAIQPRRARPLRSGARRGAGARRYPGGVRQVDHDVTAHARDGRRGEGTLAAARRSDGSVAVRG